MIDGATEAREHDSLAETRLWQAVIVSTIREWTSGPLRRKLEAERYLFSDSSDFAMVCQSAGISAGRLRGQLGLRGLLSPLLQLMQTVLVSLFLAIPHLSKLLLMALYRATISMALDMKTLRS